jgi:hypothetical protein
LLQLSCNRGRIVPPAILRKAYLIFAVAEPGLTTAIPVLTSIVPVRAGTALMFAFAIQTGINHGWLNKNKFGAAVDKASKAINAPIDRERNIREICVGTGQMNDIEFCLKRPRTPGDLHGQASFLQLVVELNKK